jgi:hypothetical protein
LDSVELKSDSIGKGFSSNSKKLTRDIYVDSSRRTEPYGNTYTMYIPDPIKNITQVDLVSAVVPNTMYNITNSNVFTIGTTHVQLDPGFYSLSSLNNILNNNQSVVTFSSLDGEGKIIASSSSSFSLTNVSSEFTNITKITNGSSSLAGSTLVQYSGKQIIKSNSVVDFHTTGNFVFLEIDELRPPYPIDAVSYSKDPSGNSNNFVFSESFRKFATIPMDTESGTLKTFKEMGDYKISVNYQIPIDRVDRLSIKWLDTNGNILNFNGVEQNSFILRFHYLEPEIKEESKFDLVKKTIKSKSLFFYFMITFVLIIFILFT